MDNLRNMANSASGTSVGPVEIPPSIKEKSTAEDLRKRLDWGEPALTIIDVRDREDFNREHILGAVAFPLDDLVPRAEDSLEKNRDIYIYGDSDAMTAQAAKQLRQAGFINVAELVGGLANWKAIGASIEGTATRSGPRP